MKKEALRKVALGFLLMVLIVSVNSSQASAFSSIVIDGYYDDWSDKPYSWEYNWDNPYIIPNYWDGTQNITKEYMDEHGNPYNLEIRHKMSLYYDGDYVYLYIKISDSYDTGMNADDYQFYVDGQMAAFRVTYVGGTSLTKQSSKNEPGIYNVEVRHRNSALSDTVVSGAEAVFSKKPDDKNNELEVKIPLTALKQQNNSIKTDNFNIIEFFTPNLMYRRIACSGVSTAPYLGIGICVLLVAGVYLVNRRFVRSKKT